ncbi:capsular biosynthesis protein [Brevundimonas sp. C43]|uniref:capsular biosynthesis protein n=1 Tax=Brevundimonas sp. C43 TaxID=3068314 RepID=UPI00273FA664|nr:capsular biosynthesis protein [Brevundimonas sp. C43]
MLESRGAVINRMIFNAGDAMNWRRPGGLVFKDTARSWSDGLAHIVADFSDVIVFGEAGAYNRAVLAAADTLNARVWVLENGYFRPDWVTVERNGVNGSSALPRFRDGYPEPAPQLPEPVAVGKILPHHVANISAYHTVQVAGKAFFPNYTAPYVFSPLKQCLGHVRRYISLAFRRPENCDADIIRDRGEFFIVCLQREGDAQLLRYSRYADNRAFLTAVITSFAAHASPEMRLVVKNHPLDPGLVNLRAVTMRLAQEHGLAGRVDFIDGGNLAALCRASRGMVVNNSSAALSALGFHTPVKVLGDAFFDFEGLTDQKPLDAFWCAPEAPDSALFTRFRAHVIAQSQVNGNYHEPHAIVPTAHGIADVFERAAD